MTFDSIDVGPAPRHPLEPLDGAEIELARDVLDAAGLLGEAAVIATLSLAEPAKVDVLAWLTRPLARRAEAVIVDRAARRSAAVIIDLDAKAVEGVTALDGQQPCFTFEEFFDGIVITKADPRWQEAIRARGIDDFDQVQVDVWSTGTFVPEGMESRRLARAVSFHRPQPSDNGYAHPIEGVVALIDLGSREVIAVDDSGVVPVPAATGNYETPPAGAPFRADLKPIEITQPDGPSFSVDGHHVQWQNWDFRLSMHPLDGLTLHQVGYHDEGVLRSILYRASLAEMVVPYGDPSSSFYWRNAFDAGEYGLGKFVNSLELGCDCVGEIHYFDTIDSDGRGNPFPRRNSICMHEEDYGVLWKHHDLNTGNVQTRRSRRLVVSSFYTVGNYEYGIFWYFYQDGTLQLEMKLTGIVQTKAIAPGQPTAHAVEIAPGLAAPHHQHLFCFRLDFDIDGIANTVLEADVVATAPSKSNAWGNAFEVVMTPVASEASSARLADASRARTWHIINEGRRNAVGQPVGYRLIPHISAPLLAQPDSPIAKRAAFATRHLWVTRHDDHQLRPAGAHPNQNRGDDGIDTWIAQDRPLLDTDTVVWHTFGPTHIARTEDWPVMPVEYAGFTLKPTGFFDRNPALDVPPSSSHCHAGHES